MSGISVTKAIYGVGSSIVDVTATVASKIKDGVLSFTVSPTALNVDDPAPGRSKLLDITYTINGGSSNVYSARDNDAVLIDAPPAREASGLQIVKAEYGYVGNYTDVTDAVQAYVKDDGSINMTVGFKEVGIPDPNPNKQKELDVTYTINGATSSAKVKDGKKFKLSAPPVEGRGGKSVKDHVGGVFGLIITYGTWFIVGFLYFLNAYTGYYLGGGKFLSMYHLVGLIPYTMFTIVPFFLFFMRLFYSSDIITEGMVEAGIKAAKGVVEKSEPVAPIISAVV